MTLSGPPLAKPVDLARVLDTGLNGNPDDTALISLETSWTWQELQEDSTRLAGNLVDAGLVAGDRVAMLMPNRCAFLVMYLACITAGLVATPLNYRYGAAEIDAALAASGAKILLAHRERAGDLGRARQVDQLPCGVIGYGQGSLEGTRFETLIEQTPKTERFPEPDRKGPAFLFFTADGNGRPKGVTHSLESLGWGAASVAAGLACTAEDCFMTAASLSHNGGLVHALGCLSAGARVAVARNFDADEILPLLRAERPSLAFMLPAALVRLVRDHGATREDFSSIRVLECGGDKVSAQLEQEFERQTGLAIREGYGLTEVSAAASNQPGRENRPGSMGTLLPGFKAEIRDGEGQAVPQGRDGRLWIKSPSAMLGYWGDAQATSLVMQEGWLDTGDVVRADKEGFLWFTGRKKQIIVHDNASISPQELEGVLREHPGVAGAGVVGVYDQLHGENVRAFVTLAQTPERPTEQELIAFVRSRVGFRAPEHIVFLEHWPVTSHDKVDRIALKRMAEAELHGPPAARVAGRGWA